MKVNPNEIEERIRLLGLDWADKDGAANLLEETKKSVLSELVNQSTSSSVAAKEHDANENPVFKLHVVNMVNARTEANRARVQYESAKLWVDLVRTAEASKRQEMKG
jgi:streptomycin 6-kinase